MTISLEEWTKDCENLKEIFEKAKNENKKINVNQLEDTIKIIEVKEDYALCKIYQSFFKDDVEIECDEDETEVIHPYGSNVMYSFHE